MSQNDPKNKGPAIVLKGARPDPMRYSIRSPAIVEATGRPNSSAHAVTRPSGLGGSSHPLSQQQPSSQQQAMADLGLPGAQQAPQVVEFSKISGLHDKSHHLTAGHPTLLSIDMFNGSTHRFQGAGRGLLIGIIVAALVVIAGAPKLRNKTIAALADGKADLISFARHRKAVAKRNSITNLDEDHGASQATRSDDDDLRPFSPKACGALIRAQLSGTDRGSLRARIQTADCYLIKDDPAGAEKALADIAARLKARKGANTGDADLGNRGDAVLTLQSALLKQGNDTAANQLIGSGCTEWRQSTACVAKLMIAAARRPVLPLPAEASRLFATRGMLPAKSEARLWLAGAQLAAAGGAGSKTIDQRYKYALEAAPKDALALRKEIYESKVMDQWQRTDTSAIKATVRQATSDLSSVPAADLVKLKLLGELADAGTNSRRLHALLTREDILFRARGDLDLLDILGPEALRGGLAKDFQQLLRRTRDYYATRYRTGSGANKRLAIWEVRSALATNDTEGAVAMLTNYKRAFGDDALSYHLRGAAYTNLTSSQPYQRQAIQEFQSALRLRRDWESLYGLGISMIRTGRTQQLQPLLADLTKLTRSDGQRYWLDMLRVELLIAQNNLKEAQRILTPYAKAEPAWITARTMQLQVYQKTGKRQLAEQLETDLRVRAGRLPFATSFEGFASPLGCMALTKRPLE